MIMCVHITHKRKYECPGGGGGGWGVQNPYELLNLRALKFSTVNKIYIFQCMSNIFVWNCKGYL